MTALRVSARDGGDGLAHLDRFEKATRLDLIAPVAITDDTLRQIRFPPHLEMLVIHGGRKLTNAGLEPLGTITTLTRLDLGASQATDEGFVHLQGLSNIRRLNLGQRDAALGCASALNEYRD